MKTKTAENKIAEKETNIEKPKEDILVIYYGKSKSVIFQSEYAKVFNKTDSTQYVFFDINLETVKYINENLNTAYCNAVYSWEKKKWDGTIETVKKYKDEHLLEEYEYFSKNSLKDCNAKINDLDNYDRQLIGINSPSGKKVIYIQLLDLRDDTINLKEILEKEFIIGHHGFFESSKYKSIQFLVEEKRFIFSGNED